MKHSRLLTVLLASAFLLAACSTPPANQASTPPVSQTSAAPTYTEATQIILDDRGILVDGTAAGTDTTAAVYTANDIIYYESGKDFTYGEGSQKDAHNPDEAAAHTVVHITKPGIYEISGKLSLGQIAVDLGINAKTNPDAVVTLVLCGMNITCEVAPAVIFYNVYECGDDDAEKASKYVDTSAAGANVIITDGTVNTVNGAYVEKIYKPDSIVLNDDKTQVEDADKLHKYDGAFYSKQSMNIYGGKENTGILNINAKNEGLDSEMHLTIHGGDIRISSGNDGINTNEDGISVTTVNGGKLTIKVTGETGEGDGIDSNGWLVINGGTVIASACSNSADAGIDSDMGIHINAGTVIASGHMLDRIEDGGQTYAVFHFAQTQTGSETVALTGQDGKTILETTPENAYSVLVFSSPDLQAGTYKLSSDGKDLSGSSGGVVGGPGTPPGGMEPPAEGQQPPDGVVPPQGDTPAEGFTRPEGGNRPDKPGGNPASGNMGVPELTTDLVIRDGGNIFSGISHLGEP